MDREFRKQMAFDSDQVLARFDLTPDEREGLARMDLAEFDQALAELDERVSKLGHN